MVLIGYARVSTAEQNLDLQLDALAMAGCKRVFKDRQSGAVIRRPGLDEDKMRPTAIVAVPSDPIP